MKICATFITISPYLGAKFDYDYIIIFLCYGSTILHKKIQVIWKKIEGVMAIFPIFNLNLNWENHRPAFIFPWKDVKFFVLNCKNI